MKKKLSILLLAILIIPVFTLLGCGTPETYKVSVSSSDAHFGIVEGQGTFTEGSDITLSATAWSGSSFVAWIFEEQTEILDNETYSIVNTTVGGKTNSSTITFKSSSETAGNYTAVFADPAMQYAKLSSWYVSQTKDSTPEAETNLKPVIMQASMTVSQGKSITSEIYTTDAVDIKENVEVEVETNSILKLAYGENYQIKIKPRLQLSGMTSSPTMNAYISYQKSTESVEETGYSYQINYSNGVYRIEYKITISGQEFYVNLLYKNLGK